MEATQPLSLERVQKPHQLEAEQLLGLLAGMGVVGPGDPTPRASPSNEEGTRGEELYLLLSGVARLSRRGLNSGQATANLVGPWETLGSRCFSPGATEEARRNNCAQAKTVCEAVKIAGVFLRRAVWKSPQAALALMTLEGRRLAEHEELLGCLLPYASVARLAALLLILEEKFGEKRTTGAPYPSTIGVGLTHGDLSDMVCCTRKSVTWAMKRLREERAIAPRRAERRVRRRAPRPLRGRILPADGPPAGGEEA